MTTLEQQARDILERMEIENAQSFSSGELVEIANLLNTVAEQQAYIDQVEAWQEKGDRILEKTGIGFRLGEWWADRPWRKR